MKISLLLLGIILTLPACQPSTESKEKSGSIHAATKMTDKEVITHVKAAINPKFKSWVLFSNGTYIILDDTVTGKKETALALMKEYGPVYAGGAACDFGVQSLSNTKGWAVSGQYEAMYTYVHPSELDQQEPSDVEVGLWGRAKRDKDGKELKIIHINP